jgi:alkylated DNA repair dioxygenase AlkB
MIGFTQKTLRGGGSLWIGSLPAHLHPRDEAFDALWALHPDQFHEIYMHGRLVKTPRWQQAYGKDYRYTGNTNRALPISPALSPLLTWCQHAIDPRLNGLLLNWYDGAQGHYIGAHRDSIIGLIPNAPIVTISLGQPRPWRLRPWKSTGFEDIEATDGAVFVLPWDTNLTYTHEVTAPARATGRRVSVTLRAFTDAETDTGP